MYHCQKKHIQESVLRGVSKSISPQSDDVDFNAYLLSEKIKHFKTFKLPELIASIKTECKLPGPDAMLLDALVLGDLPTDYEAIKRILCNE